MTWIWLLTGTDPSAGISQLVWPDATHVLTADDADAANFPPAAIVIDGRDNPPTWWLEQLQHARQTWPRVRVVLLLSFDRTTAQALVQAGGDVGPLSVLWHDEIDRLTEMIGPALKRDLRESLISILLSAAGEGDQLATEAAAEALSGEFNRRISVATLAKRLLVTPDTLRAHWRRSGLPGSPRLLADWQLICAVVEGRQRGETLEAIARSMGVQESTVNRVVRRTLDCSPSHASASQLLEAARRWAAAG